MKTLALLILPLALTASAFCASPDPVTEAVRRADDERVSATVAADAGRLGQIFSDDLVYTHSSGAVNDKASYTAAIASGQTKYVSIIYESREFKVIAAGIVLMRGRCLIHSSNSGQAVENHLAYLAVWRQEHGAWRFVAWQSCHLPAGR
jgi:ketosteroid isomerase-like protein